MCSNVAWAHHLLSLEIWCDNLLVKHEVSAHNWSASTESHLPVSYLHLIAWHQSHPQQAPASSPHPVLSDLTYRKGRKPREAIVVFWQEGNKAVMGTCGFIAGRFPVLGVDVPECAPTGHEMGQGRRPQCWCEHQKCIRTCKLDLGFHLLLCGHHSCLWQSDLRITAGLPWVKV